MASLSSTYNYDDLVNTYLTKGAEVEVCSNDDGFSGSWYIGTIIRPVKRTQKNRVPQTKGFISRKLLVEFKTLKSEKSGTEPLTEEIDAVYVRPLPPVESFPVKFKVDEDVDAYFSDGWWEGIVMKVLGNDRYSVFFRRSKEQMEFGGHQLRIHREWNRQGTWDPPLRLQENEVDVLSPGKRVEVSSDEEGFIGARFTAKVIERLANGKYVVEYELLRNEEDTAQLREVTEKRHVRPCPPDDPKPAQFKVGDQVDAYVNDGWWVGEIVKVSARKRYTVFFNLTNEEIEYKLSDLRLHQEWVNGIWVTPTPSSKA